MECQRNRSSPAVLSSLLQRLNVSKSSRNTHTLLCVPTEPPLLKSAAVIDRTAAFVARSANPPQFEEKIRENQRQDPKFAFLNSADPYHAYYRHRMDKVVRGEVEEGTAPKEGEKVEEKSEEPVVPLDIGEEPPVPEFILNIPNITAIDLCVLLLSICELREVLKHRSSNRDTIKLTALFTARRGRPFLNALSAREGRNYQFDFLRPTHSLFGYFNRLVEQYSRVLLPSKETLAQLKERTHDGARWKDLEVASKRARWEQVKREQDKKREDDKEAERGEFRCTVLDTSGV